MKTLAAAVAAGAVVAAVAVATAGGQAPQGRTLVLVEQQKGGQFAFVDNPPKTKLSREGEPRRVSPGDIEAFSTPVVDQQGARGLIAGHCIVARSGTAARHEEVCNVGIRLNEGTIIVAAEIIGETGTIVAAVTGGTGAYVGARGTLTSVTSKDGKTTTDTIELLP